MGILLNIAIIVLLFWSAAKILAPLFPNGVGGAEYAGQLVGWGIAVVFFLALFGII